MVMILKPLLALGLRDLCCFYKGIWGQFGDSADWIAQQKGLSNGEHHPTLQRQMAGKNPAHWLASSVKGI
jgi:hypothetical protein